MTIHVVALSLLAVAFATLPLLLLTFAELPD